MYKDIKVQQETAMLLGILTSEEKAEGAKATCDRQKEKSLCKVLKFLIVQGKAWSCNNCSISLA